MNTLEGLDINEISRERIQEGLVKTVQKLLNANNVTLCIEDGSKKGDESILKNLLL